MAERRFKVTYSEGSRSSTERIVIYVDKVTGVNYLFCRDGYGGGLTALLDKDGKPVVTLNEVKN